ncbi:MAG: CPBP family intramembrane metalloprotease [Asgard group archaeon]|nr:CPBP family intramembrane metalloprotease [Asgard group archaeon]
MPFYEKLQNPKNAIWTSILIMLIFGFMVIISQLISRYLITPLALNYLFELFISFSIQFVIAGFTLLVMIPFLLKTPKDLKPYKDFLQIIRLSNHKPVGKLLFIGITGTVFVLFFSLFLTSITGDLILTPENVFGPPMRDETMGWFGFIHYLIPGVWEEVFARGILLAILLKLYPKEQGRQRKAIVIGGIIFGFSHMLSVPSLISNPIYILTQVGYASIIGIAFGYIAVGTESLLPSIICHWLIDTFSVYITPGGDIILFLILFMMGVIIASGFIIVLVYKTTDIKDFNEDKRLL